jgi:hypothetical protein
LVKCLLFLISLFFLFEGGRLVAENMEWLKAEKIAVIVNLSTDCRTLQRAPITFLCLSCCIFK